MSTILELGPTRRGSPPLPECERSAVPLWRLSVDQFQHMVDAGILQDGDPVELLEGLLVAKMTKSPRHVTALQRLADLFAAGLPPGYFVRRQDPIVTEDSEPEPDIAVICGVVADFVDRHPDASETDLVVEVAHTTLAVDRGIKQRVYARAGIGEYWIVDLTTDVIEVYSQPQPTSPATYGQCQVYGRGQSIPFAVQGLPLATIPVDEILP